MCNSSILSQLDREKFGSICGKAEPVIRLTNSSSSSPVLTARNTESRTGVLVAEVPITTASSSPNFDQSSLGSDDSGICCSTSERDKLRLTRSAEYLEDDDAMMQFDESKSLESDEMEFTPESSASSHPVTAPCLAEEETTTTTNEHSKYLSTNRFIFFFFVENSVIIPPCPHCKIGSLPAFQA